MSKKPFVPSRVLTAAGACAAIVAAMVVAPMSASAAGCTGTGWNPLLSSATVNQGVGTYTPLVRGKTTLVRLFLTEPSCATGYTESYIGGKISAVDTTGNVQVVNGLASTPADAGPSYPAIDGYGQATNDSPADPMFQIPALAGTDSTPGDIAITLTATITYRYPSGTGTATQTATYTATTKVAPKPHPLRVLVVPLGDAAAPYGQQFPEMTNGGTPTTSGEYADTVVQNAMQTLSRELPVADGVGDLSSGAGLRYTLDDNAMIDLGPAPNGLGMMNYSNPTATSTFPVPFCDNPDTFAQFDTTGKLVQNTVAGQLATFMTKWNSITTNVPVDRVIGVVWQGVSHGGQYACDDGRAIINGPEAMIRLFADDSVGTINTRPNPSESGALLTMETAHTWGAVATGDPRETPDHHSKNTSADPTNTQRAYDISLAKWMGSPLSAMQYNGDTSGYEYPTASTSSPSRWNDTNTVLEAQDYLYTQCALTPGMTSQDCGSGTPIGTVGSVGATTSAQAVVLSGTTDGTKAGTIVHSYYTADNTSTTPDPNGAYHLQVSGANGVQDFGIPDQQSSSDHDGALPTDGTLPADVINFTMPTAGATSLAVWKGASPTDQVCTPATIANLPNCLYARDAQLAPPAIITTGGSSQLTNTQDFTSASGNEETPAISPTGSLVAWTTPGVLGNAIVVQQRSSTTNLPTGTKSNSISGSAPAWSPDGTQIAYETAQGDIDTVSVTNSSTGPTLGAPQTVYNHLLQQLQSPAHHPTWSPDGKKLAAEIAGDLFSFSSAPSQNANAVLCDVARLVDTPTCAVLAKDGDDKAPSWGRVGGTNNGGLVAFERFGGIYTLDPDPSVSGHPSTLRAASAHSPSWGRDYIAFTQGNNVLVAKGAEFNPGTGAWNNVSTLTTGGTDTTPSLTLQDDAVSFTRTVAGANADDVFVGTLGQSQDGPLQFTAATPGDPNHLEADFFIDCGSLDQPQDRPIIVTLRPSSVQSAAYTDSNGVTWNTASFSADYNEARACAGGGIYAQVTDGFQESSPELVRRVPRNYQGPRHQPLPAIAAPRPGAVYLQFDPLIAIGSDISGTTTNAGTTTICWRLTGPTGSGYSNTPIPVGTSACGTPIEQDAPASPTLGWKPGVWTLTATATDSVENTSASTSVNFTVLPDPAHTGSNVGVTFNPQTLYVPSSGNDVTLTVKANGQDLTKVTASTVQISQVGGASTSIPVDTASGTTGWVKNSDGTYTAKFNRQTLTCTITNLGLIGVYVPIVLSGSALDKNGNTLFSITGYDHQNPTTSPSGSTIAC